MQDSKRKKETTIKKCEQIIKLQCDLAIQKLAFNLSSYGTVFHEYMGNYYLLPKPLDQDYYLPML